MGHKVNPIGLRLGINRTWDSRWYAGNDYARLLHDDIKLRAHLRRRLSGAGVSRVVIERPAKKPRVTIYAARPGVVIGKKGQDIENLRKDLAKHGQRRGLAEHRRDPQARDRRDAGGREHRPAARAPGGVPPRDEARGAVGDAPRRAGHPDQLRRPSGRRRDRADRVVSRGPGAAAHAARGHRLRHGDGQDDLRHVRREGVDLQGRGAGARPAARRTAVPPNRRRSGKERAPCCLPSGPSSARPTRAASTAWPRAAPR